MKSARPERPRPAWYLEVVLLVGGYILFGLVRAWVDRGNPAATANAHAIQGWERNLHIDVELPLNQAMVGQPFLVYATGYFYRLCVLAVPAVLIWLYLREPARYRCLRTILVVMTLLDLPLVRLFPVAPPRFAQAGIVDYIATHDIVFGGTLRDPESGLNLLAAMPSMHVAWTSWCAYAAWTVLRRRVPRRAWLVWLFPAITAFDVLATGHHYVLDVLGGVILLIGSTGLTRWAGRRRDVAIRS